ncbi:MBL fold metallo-hydrolase [Halobacillus salinarum]|uniref:MBL fold metallo-hydrolase n=1 Tax=Halobacillus salinarum TaxID=2932257 RepID=A0ABY4EH92_9BACI|nr:MBL fold metallo-hydrolase [Halobacillus salinarum]UOQ43822.1 MBL fold metallo-hydrolase [Halobacillus salinarum]
MPSYICKTCGVQYAPSEKEPEHCIICEDERQYVPKSGQKWTTLESMQLQSFHNEFKWEEPHLFSITTVPEFAIGQTAYFIQDEEMNILWDCLTYLDDDTIERIRSMGGIDAIILSHPHYYSTQVEWAEVFDAPIYIHEDDKQWVPRESRWIEYWAGETLEISNQTAIHRLGGHFPGGAVLNWAAGNNKQGILLTGDIIQVVADPGWVSFMYSYPNLIPLPASTVAQIAAKTEAIPFNRVYNAFHGLIEDGAKRAVEQSAKRYINALIEE